jgi:DNA adenine methylase
MRKFELEPPPARRLIHYTPLRYPGGKGKLAGYIKELMKENKLLDGEYAEPYAGGAAIGLELLFHDYVSRIHINDLSRPVHAFWHSVLHRTDELCKLIRDTPLTVKAWDRQKYVFGHQEKFGDLTLGFATFFLNRTNRSGILNGGIIGGRDQTGPWKIDARFNRDELIFRIESTAKMRRRINLTRLDALDFLKAGLLAWPAKTLIYLDPPYYEKGRELYYDFYQPKDHETLSEFVIGKLVRQRWIVSYDNAPAIRDFYKGCQRLTYSLGYSARDAREGAEVIFLSDSLRSCPLKGPFKTIRGRYIKKKHDELFSTEETQRRFEAALRGARKVGRRSKNGVVRRLTRTAAPKKKKLASRLK